jgi:hypothetical protein
MIISVSGGFGSKRTPLSRGDIWSSIADPFQYILNGDGAEELYDYRRDADQQDNLIGSERASAAFELIRAVNDARTHHMSTKRPRQAGDYGNADHARP